MKISKILSGIALLLAISTFAQAETPVQVSINLIAGPNGGWICPDNMSPVFDQDAGFYGLSVINLADSLVCCYGMCGHDDGTHHNLYPIAMLAYAGVCLVYLSMRGRQQCMQSGNPPIGDTSSRDGSDPSGDFVLGGYSDSEEETWRDRVSRWRMGMGAGVD